MDPIDWEEDAPLSPLILEEESEEETKASLPAGEEAPLLRAETVPPERAGSGRAEPPELTRRQRRRARREAAEASRPPAFDPFNRFMVASKDGRVRILHCKGCEKPLERDEALSLVAWIAVLAELSAEEIAAARRAIEGA